jgi:hypothetical protein
VVGSEATKFSTTCCERIENVLSIHSSMAEHSASASRAGWLKKIAASRAGIPIIVALSFAAPAPRVACSEIAGYAESGFTIYARRDGPCVITERIALLSEARRAPR